MTDDLSGRQAAVGDEPTRVAPGIAYLRDRIVNVAFIGPSDGRDGRWVLVDAGLGGAATRIIRAAESLYGPGATPSAIATMR